MAYRFNQVKELAIYTWVSSVLPGLTVIWDKPKNPGKAGDRPDLPYATLNIVAPPGTDGKPASEYKTTDIFTRKFKKEFTLSVNIFADDKYFEYAEGLLHSIYNVTIQESLAEAGLCVRAFGNLNDLSTLISNGYEYRCQIDFFMAYAEDIDETIGQINTVESTGELSPDGSTAIITIDISETI